MTIHPIAVIGAGVIGTACALDLAMNGYPVLLLDRDQPGNGASFGNAGFVGANAIVPMAFPGTLANVPGWLFDPYGPVSVSPSRILRGIPWFMRFAASCTEQAALRTAAKLSALNGDVLAGYDRLLGQTAFDRLVRLVPNMTIWREKPTGPAADLKDLIFERHGIATQALSGAELYDYEPALSRDYNFGLLVRDSGFIANPHGLVEELLSRFLDRGGKFLKAVATGFQMMDGRVAAVRTSQGLHSVQAVVIAAGISSPSLCRHLGIAARLEAERGYHLTFARSADHIRGPIVDAANKIAMTPMDGGLRVTGFAEFADPDGKPDAGKWERLELLAKRALPKLEAHPDTKWMGCRPSTPDSMPVVSRSQKNENVFLAFGHGHYGMSGAPGTAREIVTAFSADNRFLRQLSVTEQ